MSEVYFKKQTVLILEDESTQRRLLRGQLESLGFHVMSATNGREGIKIWRDNPNIRIVITDLEMPGGDGLEVVKTIREMASSYTYLMVLTIHDKKETLLQALSLGADDYVHKPIIKQELVLRLKAAQRLMHLEDHEKLIYSFAHLAAGRSQESDVHLKRIKEYCFTLADDLRTHYPELGLTKETVQDIANISVMHDIGNVCIPDELLHKRGKHTPDELKILQNHTMQGGAIFKNLLEGACSNFVQLGYDIVLGHHEKWDGSGFPGGLKGEEIPLAARIVALADAYDEIRSRKAYKDSFPASYADSLIISKNGIDFDPRLIEAYGRNKEIFDKIHANYPE